MSDLAGATGGQSRTSLHRVPDLYVVGPEGLLAATAGRDLTLTASQAGLVAEGGLALLAARNTAETKSGRSSASGGVGVGISLGSGGVSAGITAHASASRGKGEGNDVTWTTTHITAGDRLTLESGGDTTLGGRRPADEPSKASRTPAPTAAGNRASVAR